MRVFVTGASGWIGSATVDELLESGHQVIGLARSDSSAATLDAKGATVLRGDLDDLASLRTGAADADAVIHLANKHDFANQAATNRAERTAVETIAEALAGSDRPFVLASGLGGLTPGEVVVETERSSLVGPDAMRGGSENLALDYVDRGVRAIAARFAPTVHGIGDHGFIALIAAAARKNGVSSYVGDGSAAWSAVHHRDAARLLRLAIEQAPAGTILHVVGEEAVSTRDIAQAIGEHLGVPVTSVAPEQAIEQIGFVGQFFGMDLRASSALTRERFGWDPTGPTLLEDIKAGGYPGV
ncbi:MAG TPA: SDR family oxidoreductase [Pseudonocardiaceae bacterium]|nr:SDR family oxidoreductase [Pseudonocardiaceae bacterium]